MKKKYQPLKQADGTIFTVFCPETGEAMSTPSCLSAQLGVSLPTIHRAMKRANIVKSGIGLIPVRPVLARIPSVKYTATNCDCLI